MGLLDAFKSFGRGAGNFIDNSAYNNINSGLLNDLTGQNLASDPSYGLLSTQNAGYQQANPLPPTQDPDGGEALPQLGAGPRELPGRPGGTAPPPSVQMPTAGPASLTDQQRRQFRGSFLQQIGAALQTGQPIADRMEKYNQGVAQTVALQRDAQQQQVMNQFRQEMAATNGDATAMKAVLGKYSGVLGSKAIDEYAQALDRLNPRDKHMGKLEVGVDPATGKPAMFELNEYGAPTLVKGMQVPRDLFMAQNGDIMDRHDPTFKMEANSPETMTFRALMASGKSAPQALEEMKGYGKTVPTDRKGEPDFMQINAMMRFGIDPKHPELATPQQSKALADYLKPAPQGPGTIAFVPQPDGGYLSMAARGGTVLPPGALTGAGMNTMSTAPKAGPLLNVAPHLVLPAANANSKVRQSYDDATQAAEDMQTVIDDARHGNKVAYSYAPVEGVLSLNSGRGVKRINMPEVTMYKGAGSAADNIQGYVGKVLSGASLPPGILNDMESFHKDVRTNAAKAANRKIKDINDTYGSAFPTIDLGAMDGAQQTPAGGVPAVGGMFNGQPVTSVKRIK